MKKLVLTIILLILVSAVGVKGLGRAKSHVPNYSVIRKGACGALAIDDREILPMSERDVRMCDSLIKHYFTDSLGQEKDIYYEPLLPYESYYRQYVRIVVNEHEMVCAILVSRDEMEKELLSYHGDLADTMFRSETGGNKYIDIDINMKNGRIDSFGPHLDSW